MAKDFELYFSRENVIKKLCKYRLKAATKKHKIQMVRDVSFSKKSLQDVKNPRNNCPEVLSRLLPPRRQWIRPSASDRNSGKFTDSTIVNSYSIIQKIKSVEHGIKKGKLDVPKWYTNLNVFIEKVQRRASNPQSVPIKKPRVAPIKKNNKKQDKSYRPISLYDMEDNIVISLTAKYLTDLFDDHFLPSSYAFRSVKKWKALKSHHETIVDLERFRKQNIQKGIYVAECDIANFFDCINHEQTLALFNEQVQEHGLKLDENAYKIFVQYLESYSFSQDVYPKNGTDYFVQHKIPGGYFAWKKDKLIEEYYNIDEVGKNIERIRIGVPQGGAISCFISNLVLHTVDKKLENTDDPFLLYERFCDDMILLHTDNDKCHEYLDKYKVAVKKLKLLVHEPKIIEKYDANFWDDTMKSKAPYKWDVKNSGIANVPWVSFVGYQLRYDGSCRIRKKSLKKEFSKQREQREIIENALLVRQNGVNLDINETSRKSKRQQLFALNNRYISMSVGKIKWYKPGAEQTLCWTVGFKALNKNKIVARQLRKLDSYRARQLLRFRKNIKYLDKSSVDEDESANKENFYFGGPYSYHGFLNRQKKRNNGTSG